MHKIRGCSTDAPKGIVSPCQLPETCIQSFDVANQVDGAPKYWQRPGPFDHFNFWYELLHVYEISWLRTLELLQNLYDFVPPAEQPDKNTLEQLQDWGTLVGDTGLPNYYTANILNFTLVNSVSFISDLLQNTPKYDKNKTLMNLRSTARQILGRWKRSFLESHVHIFFGCFRCLTNHDLLIHPFKCPFSQPVRHITLQEYLVHFNWDTVGLYYMVAYSFHLFHILLILQHYFRSLISLV
jgi:hypothetical protein